MAVELRSSSLTVDASELPATQPGQGLLRVFAGDGVNTSYADVSVLSIAK